MNIFLSTQSIDDQHATQLLTALRAAGHRVDHSPRNPIDGDDDRWPTWYSRGLAETLKASDCFIIIVDRGWDSSSWMATEADDAKKLELPLRFWNPQNLDVTAPGMIGYLREQMPDDIDSLIARIDSM